MERNDITQLFASNTDPDRESAPFPSSGGAEPRSYRLSRKHLEDLRDIAHGVEEGCAGVGTRYLVDHLTEGRDREEVSLYEAEQWCEKYDSLDRIHVAPWRRRMERARRALERLRAREQHRSFAILHVAYGPVDPITRDWPASITTYFGRDLISLVRYTEATETARQQLVRLAAFAELTRSPFSFSSHVSLRTSSYPPMEQMVNLTNFRKVAEREDYDDQVITSGDALRYALSPIRELHRPAFLTSARADAQGMLDSASRDYHDSWLQEASHAYHR
jgi:hypothetical protein